MPSVDEAAKAWELGLCQRVGEAVAKRRKALGWTALELAETTRELGYPISRVSVTKIETNSRAGKLDIGEVMVLAAALQLPPLALLYPGDPDGDVAMLPNQQAPGFHAMAWFSGDRDLAWPGPEVIDPDAATGQADQAVADPDSQPASLLRLVRERAAMHRDLVLSRVISKKRIAVGKFSDDDYDRAVEYDARLIGRIDDATARIKKAL